MKNKITEKDVEVIREKFLEELNSVNKENISHLENKYLGRKGEIRKLFQQVADLENREEKKILGQLINNLSSEVKQLLEQKKNILSGSFEKQDFLSILEYSLPGRSFLVGKVHPLQQTLESMLGIFRNLGFEVKLGPEIETEDYNFTKLNIPEDHPARDMQDTLYVDLFDSENKRMLLRTHTSPVQIRTMLEQRPPIKAVMPGRVYRRDDVDASHQFNFHQIEGLLVDKNVKLSDLKGVLNYFIKSFFGDNVKNTTGEISRFRQSYFPFTEPSLEMDMQCLICKGKGCPVCKNTGYIELLGCGMVHPQVLKNVGIDPEMFTGFAFGIGVERVAMLKYGIDDMRLFYLNDIRFLRQF